MDKTLVLASSSPRRSDLLQQIGISDFVISASDISESVLPNENARQYCARMAKEKADCVYKRLCLTDTASDGTLNQTSGNTSNQTSNQTSDSTVDTVTGDTPYILAADTVVATGRRILPKAEDKATAKQCLELLSGKRHRVYGGLHFITPDVTHTAVIQTTVQFKKLSQSEVRYYLDSNDWNGKAGGYAIQGLASQYISFISGSYTNVVGMDVHTVSNWLKQYTILHG